VRLTFVGGRAVVVAVAVAVAVAEVRFFDDGVDVGATVEAAVAVVVFVFGVAVSKLAVSTLRFSPAHGWFDNLLADDDDGGTPTPTSTVVSSSRLVRIAG